jgi:hypothetical protein
MEDILYAVCGVLAVGTVSGLSLLWSWAALRKMGLLKAGGESPKLRTLEARLAELERENSALAVEVESLGEHQRFVTKLLSDRAHTGEGNPAR